MERSSESHCSQSYLLNRIISGNDLQTTASSVSQNNWSNRALIPSQDRRKRGKKKLNNNNKNKNKNKERKKCSCSFSNLKVRNKGVSHRCESSSLSPQSCLILSGPRPLQWFLLLTLQLSWYLCTSSDTTLHTLDLQHHSNNDGL